MAANTGITFYLCGYFNFLGMKCDRLHPKAQNTSNEYFADQENHFICITLRDYVYSLRKLPHMPYASRADNCIWSNKFPWWWNYGFEEQLVKIFSRPLENPDQALAKPTTPMVYSRGDSCFCYVIGFRIDGDCIQTEGKEWITLLLIHSHFKHVYLFVFHRTKKCKWFRSTWEWVHDNNLSFLVELSQY